MLNSTTIGIIGGGQMGEALIRGIIQSGLLAAEKIMVIDPDRERCDLLNKKYSVLIAEDKKILAATSSVLILGVKPQVMGNVLDAYRQYLTDSHLLISIAAGVTIEAIEKGLGKKVKIVRVMPNTPALVLAGASALSPNSMATREDVEIAVRIFSAVGTCQEIEEKLLDAVTGLSGSGPGYVFAFIEAMIDGGVLAGLPRTVAEKLVLQTVYGAAKMAIETGEPPAVLKGRVTSPGGTTITGLQVLEESGFHGTIMAAVEAATKRSKELGQ
ncbi:MAG: pyrroline-5-carboxylate reductase [Desulfobulbaceae bacterium]|nr:pyrroline-5-carboxylate reductase [Desulfobulbaceae bacterium]